MTIRVALVGIGGYGASHLNQLEREWTEGRIELSVAVVQDFAEFPESMARLPEDTRVYKTIDACLEKEKGNIDLMLLPTGISTHWDFSVAAMEAGFNVGVEKPPAGVLEDALDMAAVSESTGKFCAVGFQNIYSRSFRKLKSFIADGGIGDITDIRSLGLWKRSSTYYERNDWAGNLKYNNQWIFDGPFNNPLSHQMVNMLFLAGNDPILPAEPTRVRAEFYRGRDWIEGEDTDCMEVECANGARLFFYATLCAKEQTKPEIIINGTKGQITYYPGESMNGVDHLGEALVIPDSDEGNDNFIHSIIDHMSGKGPLFCPVALTAGYMQVMNGAYESAGKIHTINNDFLETTETDECEETWIKNIDTDARTCFEQAVMYSEAGLPWAASTAPKWFPLTGYCRFSGMFPRG